MAFSLLGKSIILLFLKISTGLATPILQSVDVSLDGDTLDFDVAEPVTSVWGESFKHESHCDFRAQHLPSSSSSIVARADSSLADNGESQDLAQAAESKIWILVPPNCPKNWFALCCRSGELERGKRMFCTHCKVPIQ